MGLRVEWTDAGLVVKAPNGDWELAIELGDPSNRWTPDVLTLTTPKDRLVDIYEQSPVDKRRVRKIR